jgi:hypothetical protein
MDESRHLLRCQGKLKDGRDCNVVLAARASGSLYVKRDGYEYITSNRETVTVRCGRCHCLTEIPAQDIRVARVEEIEV